jgi:ribonuclease J
MSGRLRCVPLGGLGEIGRNMMVIEDDQDIVIIDCGVMFPENEMLGVDLVIPDVTYLASRLDRIRGIILTHGHEDHVGALPYILPQLAFPPLWATPLTAGLISGKLREHRLADRVQVNHIDPADAVTFGDFVAEFFYVCHSVPDGVGVALRTPAGTIVHTGDFKFDHTPVDGRPTDFGKLAEVGRKGVLCLFSDSTHADRPGHTPSERVIDDAFERIFASAEGRIIVTTFASLISRVQQVIDASIRHGRRVGIVGRSMVQNVGVAQELGYIVAPPGVLLRPDEIACVNDVPGRGIVLVTTGSQGEPTSALARMANRDHRQVQIVPGDTVVLSAAPIPGNEELVARTIDNLFRLGAHVHWGVDRQVHVSGHASQEELKLMISLIRPRYVVPVHGEYRHLVMHARLAEELSLPNTTAIVIEDGDILEFSDEGAAVVDKAPAGYVFVDGLGVGDVGQVVLRDRRVLAQDGVLIVSLAVERESGRIVGDPDIVTRGFVYMRDAAEIVEKVRSLVEDTVEAARASSIAQWLPEGDEAADALADNVSWADVRARIRDILSKYVYEQTRRRPMILPLVIEL